MAIQTIDNFDNWVKNVQDEVKQSATDFVGQMSPGNVDFSLWTKSRWSSKQLKLGGRTFEVAMYWDDRVCELMTKHLKNPKLGCVVQIWSGNSSAIMAFSKEMLDDARKDYRDNYIVPESDVLTQIICCLRLNTDKVIIHHIAMALAYNHKDVRGELCHAVWD